MLIVRIGERDEDMTVYQGTQHGKAALHTVQVPTGSVGVSYAQPVAAFIDGRKFKDETYYSRTTDGHVNTWLAAYPGEEVEEVTPEFFYNLIRAGA